MVRHFILSLSLLLAFLGTRTEDAHAFQGERRYAIVIGNNVGQARDAELRYAQEDALRFSSVMRKHGGLKAENTVVMLGDSAIAIKRAIVEINARIRIENDHSRAPSTLIVYYSGHADADGLHPGEASLSYEELRALLRGSAANVRLLILDGCRSGGLTRVKGGTPAQRFQINAQSNDSAQGMVMISSSAAGEDSHESDTLRASFFSHHFINGLVGAADEDANGQVSLREAYGYAYRNTLRTSGRGVQLQHPTYSYQLKGRDDVLMTDLASAQKAGRLRLGEPGEYLLYRGAEGGEIVAELNVVQKHATIAVASGRYLVQLRRRDHYREFDVRVERGAITTIDSEKGRKVAYARLVRKGGQHQRIAHQLYSRVGIRGALLDGDAASPSLLVGYQFDLPTMSIALRGRFNQPGEQTLAPNLQLQQRDWGLGVAAQHYFDYETVSVGVGLVTEAVQFRQSFSGASSIATRNSLAFSFGALLTVERTIGERLVVSLEGGPVTYLMRKARTETGEEISSEGESVLTGFLNLGAGVLF